MGMNKGGSVEVRGIRVSMVHADHSAGDWSVAEGVPIYLGEPAGFVVELENGRRLYHAGDTALFGDMRLINELHRPDVAFLPIGGHYTMDPAAAARAVELLGAATVVPLHYGTFPVLTGTPDQLRTELELLGLGRRAGPRPGTRCDGQLGSARAGLPGHDPDTRGAPVERPAALALGGAFGNQLLQPPVLASIPGGSQSWRRAVVSSSSSVSKTDGIR